MRALSQKFRKKLKVSVETYLEIETINYPVKPSIAYEAFLIFLLIL